MQKGALLGSLDRWVILIYAVGLVGLGVLAVRRHARPEDYFLASRRSRWPAIGLALIASNMSSTALVGLAGAAYATGISVYDYEWSAGVVLVFFCLFLLPFVLASRVYTMPEFLERRYDGRARLYFAALTLFLNVFVDSAGALYSGSLVCRLLFPGTALWLIVTVLAGAAALYTVAGGLRAVIFTEIAQGMLLFAAAAIISVVAFTRAGGWHEVMSRAPSEMLSLIRPASDPTVPWPGLLLGIPVLGFYYWCTNQFIVQRVLSARSLDDGRWGALLAGVLKLPILFLMVLPGTCAAFLFPRLTRADMVYPALMLELLPAGLLGVVLAGFIASTMACVASTLNSASALLTLDIVRRAAPSLPEAGVLRIGRLITAGLLVVSVLWAPQLQYLPSLWAYLQAVLAYAVPPIVALFVVGLFWRGANATGAAATLLLGTACGLGLFVSNMVFHWTHLHFLYVSPLLLAIDTAILMGVSHLTRHGSRPPAADLIWTLEFFRRESHRLATLPLWKNYRVHSGVLLALTAWVVIVFR